MYLTDNTGSAKKINAPDPSETGAISAGSTLGLEQGLLAKAGQPGLTVLAVGYTTSFSAGNVLHREFMSLGEPICFTGLSNGAIIQASQGFYGFSEQLNGSYESPMPLLSYGLSFKSTFFYAFRNSNIYAPNSNSANQGWVHIVN